MPIPGDALLQSIAPAATDTSLLSNYSIIAHIDHSKYKQAETMLKITGLGSDHEMRDQ